MTLEAIISTSTAEAASTLADLVVVCSVCGGSGRNDLAERDDFDELTCPACDGHSKILTPAGHDVLTFLVQYVWLKR